MKRIIALGDTHGRLIWQDIVNKNLDADKIIFIGDYWDSREGISIYQQEENFKNIIAYKKANMDKVILLIGNHDFHYTKHTTDRYSLFQPHRHIAIQELLHNAFDENLLQISYVHNNFLFTHAGVTKVWCENYKINMNNLQYSINDLFNRFPQAFKFQGFNGYGDDVTQSPIWVRSKSLYLNKIPNYTQIVGHTTMDTITGLNGSRKIYVNGIMVETSGVIFIDTLGTSGEYLQIVDGVISATK